MPEMSVQEISPQSKDQTPQKQHDVFSQQERDIFGKMYSDAIFFKNEDIMSWHTSKFVNFLDTLNANKTVLEKTIASDSPDDISKSLDILDQFFSSGNRYYIHSYLSDDDPRLKGEEIKDFSNFGVDFLHKNMGRVEEMLDKNPDWELMNKSLKINILLSDEDASQNKEAEAGSGINFLLRNVEKAVRMGSHELQDDEAIRDFAQHIPVFSAIFNSLDSSQVEQGKQIVVNLLKDQDPKVRTITCHSIRQIEETSNILSASFGIDGKKAITAWKEGNKFLFADSVLENLLYLAELEQKKPGIGKVLQEEFGINNFVRYPQELLISQYEQKDVKDSLPCGVVVYPQSDHNGGFFHNKDLFEKLSSQLEGKYRFRVWEVGSVLGLVEVLNKSRHRYGPASFAIIGGHGSPEKIRFGESVSTESEKELAPMPTLPDTKIARESVLEQKKHVARKGAPSVRLAFVEKPTIILSSCSTGQLGGIGQEISQIAGAKVIAPPESVSVKTMDASINHDGTINFEVMYLKDEKDVPPQIYKEGVLQRS